MPYDLGSYFMLLTDSYTSVNVHQQGASATKRDISRHQSQMRPAYANQAVFCSPAPTENGADRLERCLPLSNLLPARRVPEQSRPFTRYVV
jgi:hypothetical protein